MSKIRRTQNFRHTRGTEKIIQNFGWLILTVIASKRRAEFFIIIPRLLIRDVENDSSLWSYKSTMPRDCRIKKEVFNHFDPGSNRRILPPDTTNAEPYLVKWRFRDIKKAEEAITFALLKWNENSWFEKDTEAFW